MKRLKELRYTLSQKLWYLHELGDHFHSALEFQNNVELGAKPRKWPQGRGQILLVRKKGGTLFLANLINF